jgi:acyl-CoA thioesterase
VFHAKKNKDCKGAEIDVRLLIKTFENMNIENNIVDPAAVVAHMMEHDLFSRWLGITVLEIAAGYSKIQMTVRPEMINGFGIVHGGIAFSLADSAFAFACNNRNNLSVALDTGINFIKPVHVDDVLIAEAKEMHNGRTTGLYHITITNQKDHIVALFKGTCFRTGKPLVKPSA